MSQTKAGAVKIAAQRAGFSVAEYQRHVAGGLKWCISCRCWHPRGAFGVDLTRHDGLVPSCRDSKNRKARRSYRPCARPSKGRSFVPARDGDRRQARRRINYFVEAGLLPHPNSLPCKDCGHAWREGERRHEYDHHLGYAAEHHEHVEPVCTTCHHGREKRRTHGAN